MRYWKEQGKVQIRIKTFNNAQVLKKVMAWTITCYDIHMKTINGHNRDAIDLIFILLW